MWIGLGLAVVETFERFLLIVPFSKGSRWSCFLNFMVQLLCFCDGWPEGNKFHRVAELAVVMICNHDYFCVLANFRCHGKKPFHYGTVEVTRVDVAGGSKSFLIEWKHLQVEPGDNSGKRCLLSGKLKERVNNSTDLVQHLEQPNTDLGSVLHCKATTRHLPLRPREHEYTHKPSHSSTTKYLAPYIQR